MRRVLGEELKEIQLQILDVVAAFCEQNGIQYWIDNGTLLGAIRHRGYIPWDDDIDVGMLREDYDRFSSSFNCNNKRYQFVCIENTSDFYLPHGKVCDTSTVLYEPDKNGNKLAINIDIFVYDNAPDDDEELKKMYVQRDKLRLIHARQKFSSPQEENIAKRVLKLLLRTGYRICFSKNSIEKMVENSKKYAACETARVGNFTSYTRMVCNKRVFSSFVDVEFEGRRYKAPVGYDEWLRSFYGDYMKLPPEEKRVSHHTFEAFVID